MASPGGSNGIASTPAGDAGDLPPYEQARDELTELVRRLEKGGLSLAESLKLWERGEELAAVCEQWLEGARARLAAVAGAERPGRAPGADLGEPF